LFQKLLSPEQKNIDQKMRLTKGLETSPSVTVPFREIVDALPDFTNAASFLAVSLCMKILQTHSHQHFSYVPLS
jgi:hypothetical protein